MEDSDQEVLIDTSLEDTWSILEADELLEDQPPSPLSQTDRNSDIEAIEAIDEDDQPQQHVANSSNDLRRQNHPSFFKGSYDSLADLDLDLSPGRFKAYVHVPNESVNVWLNMCLLVTCAVVAGLGLGNYFGSIWMDSTGDQMKTVQKQLTDCLENQQILLHNISSISRMLKMTEENNISNYLQSLPLEEDIPIMTTLITPSDHRELTLVPSQVSEGVEEAGFTDRRYQINNDRQSVTGRYSINLKKGPKVKEDLARVPSVTEYSFKKGQLPKDKSTATNMKFKKKSESLAPNIVIETSSFLEGLQGSKNGLIIWLLISERGLSEPTFFDSREVSLQERKKVVDTIFRPFLHRKFGHDDSYQIWIETTGRKVWSDMDAAIVTPDRNPFSKIQRQIVKKFWANIRKSLRKLRPKRGKGQGIDMHFAVKKILSEMDKSILGDMFAHLKTKMNIT